MDIRLIRRHNLSILLKEAKTLAALAARTGVNEKYLSQIVTSHVGTGRKSRREIGHDIARRLEAGMLRHDGWMDVDHQATAATGEHRKHALHVREPAMSADEYEVLAHWRQLFEDQREELMAKLRAEAERARRIEDELKRRRLDKAVPDREVAKHLPARPRQRELPTIPGPQKKPGKR